LPSPRPALQDAYERPTSNDIPALYHALEGSVVLLQVEDCFQFPAARPLPVSELSFRV